jgi:hypothetical protein
LNDRNLRGGKDRYEDIGCRRKSEEKWKH